MLLEVVTKTNYEFGEIFKIISLIIIIIASIELLITIIRMLYVKLNYINTIDANIIGSYETDGSAYTHSDYSSNYAPLSKSGGSYYCLKYVIDGKEYKADISKFSTKLKGKGRNMIAIKYHKNNPNKIVKAYDKTCIYIISLCLLFIIGFLIPLIIL